MGGPLGLIILVLLAAAFGARFRYRKPIQPRLKPGESPAEARLILLGTYRIYSWLVLCVVVTAVVGVVTNDRVDGLPLWYQIGLSLLGVALLLVANALYWRLGYDRRRWIFVAGHLTGAFCLAEYLWALRTDVESYMKEFPGSTS